MIIKSIELENIRSYTNERIEFPLGSVLLAGDIGCGKSTILLSIEFALFGIMKGDVSANELLRHGSKEGSVTLSLDINGKEVIIKRALRRGNSSIAQDSGYLILEGVKTDLVAKELKARILKLLGYSEALLNKSKSLIYRYTVYTPQEDMKRIILSSPEERLDTLRMVFGIDKYKTIKENITLIVRELKKKISYVEGQTQDLEELKSQASKKEDMRKEIENVEKDIMPILDKARADVKISYLELLKKEKEIDDIRKEKNNLRLIESNIDNCIRNIKGFEERIKTETQRISTLEQEINGERKVNEEKLALKIGEMRNDILRIRKDNNEITKKIGESEFLKKESENLVKKIVSLSRCPVCLQDVDDLHKHGIRSENDKKIDLADRSLEGLYKEKEMSDKNILEIEKKLLEYEEIRKKTEIYKIKIKQVEEKRREIEKIKENMTKQKESEKMLLEKKKESETKITDTKGIEENYLKLRKEHLALQAKEKEEEIRYARVLEQKRSIHDIIEGLKKQVLIKEELKAKLAMIRKMQNWLSDHFENIIVSMEKHVFLNIYNEFNDLVAKWFEALIGDESISLRLNTDFTPTLEQNGYETTIDNLSGGEKTAVALSYRLALNKVINDMISSVNTKDIIILDEPTDGFSAEQLDRVHDVLEELKLPQMIIVSHEPKIEGFVDNVIRIQKQSHESRVI